MTCIIKPVTKDGLAGYDAFNQFWVFTQDRFDPNSRKGSIRSDLRGKTCMLCNKQWEVSATSLADQFFARREGVHVHYTCYERHLSFLDRGEWMDAIAKSGLYARVSDITEIPNQYGGAWNVPWYCVELKGKPTVVLTFGQRKRVRSIQVDRLNLEQIDALESLFKAEDTTKDRRPDGYIIHAWTLDKAVAYFTSIDSVLGSLPAVSKHEQAA